MKKTLLSIFIIGSALLFGGDAVAQRAAPQMLVTWRTDTYVPPEYPGKPLPGKLSPIVVSFELIDNGQVVDLSKETIYWYVDDDLWSNKRGVHSIQVRASDVYGGDMSVRIEIPSYRGRAVIKTVDIPAVAPKAVIESPFSDGLFKDLSLRFKAKPFFFRTPPSSLSYEWSVNGEPPAGDQNPDELTVALSPDTPPNASLLIQLTIQNPRSSQESAIAAFSLNRAP